MSPMHELEHELEGELEHEHEFELEGEFEGEFELEHEGEFELEGELNPVRKVYLDAMLEMEHLMSAASEAEHENQAEQFFPLLLPLAAKLAPLAMKGVAKLGAKVLPKLLNKVGPRLMKGVGRIGRMLARRRRSRPLLRTMPTIVRRTVGNIARQAARGRNVTPQAAQRILARQAASVLRNPQQVQRALRLSRRADQAYHRRRPYVGGCGARARRSCGCGCGCRRSCCD